MNILLNEDYLNENFKKITEKVEDKNFEIVTETWTDGKVTYVRMTQTSKKFKEKQSEQVILNLQKELKIAIEKEEFEKAAKLRDKIKSLKTEKAS
ncbi:hypothetical protein EBU94_03445 [bacterium]|nr:hypothetical protein [bacterium]